MFKRYKVFNKKESISVTAYIYYAQPGLNIGNKRGKWSIIKFEGEKLEKAIDNFLLYEDYRCFTTEQEAQDFIKE